MKKNALENIKENLIRPYFPPLVLQWDNLAGTLGQGEIFIFTSLLWILNKMDLNIKDISVAQK